MQKNAIIALVLTLLAMGLYFVFQSGPKTIQTPPSEVIVNEGTKETTVDLTGDTGKVFEVTGKNFSFEPKEVKVTQGDRVQIVFKNEGGTHNFVLDEFDVKTKTTNTGETVTVEFVADKAGTFEYYCGIGNHRAMGMVGTLVVE